MQRLSKFVSFSGRFGALPFGLFVWLSLAAGLSSAQQSPLNDNFANAQALQGPNGVATGDNTGGTLETGEPVVPNTTGGASIWYVWTAPANGAFSFDTLGSALADTTLGVYTGNTVNNLRAVAQNDDADPANGILQSALTFVATAGTTYYIAVDSYDPVNCTTPPCTGPITLNWGPQELFAGDFSFTSPLYLFSENESFLPIDGRMADASAPEFRTKIT